MTTKTSNCKKAIADTKSAINNGTLKSLMDGAPSIGDETFYTISSQYAIGPEQDRIIEKLSELFPEYAIK